MEITRDESLKLLGLFKLATEHYTKVREFEFAIGRALGRGENELGPMADAIYTLTHSTADFYDALAREGVTIINADKGG